MSGSIQDTFFEECEELLEATDEGLTAIEGGDHDPEVVNAIFRAVHSIKGGAGAFGLDDLVAFAHRFETVFDEVRSNRLELDDQADPAAAAVQRSSVGAWSRRPVTAARSTKRIMILCLRHWMNTSPKRRKTSPSRPMGLGGSGAGDADLGIAPAAPAEPQEETYRIRFQPLKEMYGTGNEPFFLFQALKDMGELTVIAGRK